VTGDLKEAARQRTCFVGADDGGRTEGLHARESADEHPARGQSPGADRQKEREDERELLGNRCHGQADRAEQCARPRLVAGEAEPEQRHSNEQGDHAETPHQHGHLLLQRAWRPRGPLDQRRYATVCGRCAGCLDVAESMARPHHRSRKHGRVTWRIARLRGPGVLRLRLRFTGE
jgi:hypothetical protein